MMAVQSHDFILFKAKINRKVKAAKYDYGKCCKLLIVIEFKIYYSFNKYNQLIWSTIHCLKWSNKMFLFYFVFTFHRFVKQWKFLFALDSNKSREVQRTVSLQKSCHVLQIIKWLLPIVNCVSFQRMCADHSNTFAQRVKLVLDSIEQSNNRRKCQVRDYWLRKI